MLFSDIEPALRTSGKITASIGGFPLTLDLSNPHERRYAAWFVADIQYPSLDIDRFLIREFLRPGDRVLDAGANIGLTALLFAEEGAAEIVSLEPLPDLADRIRAIGCPKINCYQYALSSERGEITFFVSRLHNQGSTYDPATMTLFPQVFGEHPRSLSVKTTTIDALETPFDVWKLDIEGAEVDALAGAARTLKKSPPRVIFAELYGDKFEQFAHKIRHSHPHAYRACITKAEYELVLFDPVEYEQRAVEFHQLAPTFVFLREPFQT